MSKCTTVQEHFLVDQMYNQPCLSADGENGFQNLIEKFLICDLFITVPLAVVLRTLQYVCRKGPSTSRCRQSRRDIHTSGRCELQVSGPSEHADAETECSAILCTNVKTVNSTLCILNERKTDSFVCFSLLVKITKKIH